MQVFFKEKDPESKDTEPKQHKMPGEEKIEIAAEIPEEFERILYPSRLPQGFILTEVDTFGGGVLLELTNGEQIICIDYYMKDNSSLNVDTESSSNSYIKINEQNALLQSTEEADFLYWGYDDYIVSLHCGIEVSSLDQIVKIAESIRWHNISDFVLIKNG